ncbi:2-oxoacid:acceptor oxidoreductase family protein, partial [Candidatus Aerophobetes bacterium]|nr:2-oxoacid:acceptor oxidoreductase family protein [Candidatus Aerophobetes bacterium]
STLLDAVDVTLGLREEGVILVNSPETPQAIRRKLGLNKGKVFTVDATSISMEILGKNLPNIPMLGALIKVTSLLGLDTVISSIEHKFGKKFSSRIIEGNIEAIKKAYEEVKEE